VSRYLLGVALAHVDHPRPRRRRRGAYAAVPLAVVLGALVLVGAAEARSAKFRVSIEGKQRVTWQENRVDQGYCPSVTKGAGSETVRFRSRSYAVTAVDIGSGVIWRRGRRPAVLPTSGTVSRRGSSTLTPMYGPDRDECYGTRCSAINPCDGAGWTPPPPPDCGKRRFSLYLIGLHGFTKDRLYVSDDNPPPLGYRNCTFRGPGFPDLMAAASGRMIAPRFPRDEVFDESLGKELIIGRGSEPVRGVGVTGRASVEWTLEFVRIRR
jgi:hypothetical protein